MGTKKVLPTGIDIFGGNRYRVRKRILGKDFCKYFDKLEDANHYLLHLKDKQKKIALGIDIGFESKTLKEFAAHYMRIHYHEWALNTLDLYNRILSDVLPHLGDRPMHQIFADDISELLHGLMKKRDWTPATFNRYHTLLKQLFKAAIEQRPVKHATDNPMNQIKKLPEPIKPRVIFTKVTDMETFLSKAWSDVNPTYWIGVNVLLNTGLRLGESIALRRGDIEFDHANKCGRLTVSKARNTKTGVEQSTKTKHHRVVRFGGDLYRALMTWYKHDARATKDSLVIRWVDSGQGISGSHFSRLHRDFVKACGLPRVSLHGLRHSFATHTLAKSQNLRAVQSILGHASYETTLRYAQTLQDALGRDFGLSVGGTQPNVTNNVIELSRGAVG